MEARDLTKVEPYVPPGDYELPQIAGRQNAFVWSSALAFAILYTERGVYAHLASGQRSTPVAVALISVSAIIVFLGFLASFYLPPRLMPEADQTRWIPHTLNFLIGQLGIAVACVAGSGLIALAAYSYLVYPDLLALSWLLRDGFMYLALGALIYQGFVTFVRYLGFLYQTGGADKLKVISFELAATVFVIIMGLYQYTVDLVQVLGARPDQGMLVLHLTVRDIWLAVMVGVIFVWQIGRAGDH
jgi:hypothetical protein